MISMELFDENDNQTLLKELASYQIDTYGNADILKVFHYVKSQGWLVPGSVIFEKLRSMTSNYDKPHTRNNTTCVLLKPLAEYVDSHPSEEDLITFYDLDFEAKRFVSKFPGVIPDLTDVLKLSEAGLFASMSNEACLLAIDCYGVEVLKNGKYNKAMSSIEILLKTWSEYRCGMPLEELISYSEKISIQQALVLDILMRAGFTLEKLAEDFLDWDKLMLCLDTMYTISTSGGNVTPADFGMLLHFMYLQFEKDELKTLVNVKRVTCSSIYLYGMFKCLEQGQNYPDLKKDLSKLQYIPQEYSSVEIVVDGASKVILPVDASIDHSIWSIINSIFVGVRAIAHEFVQGAYDNKLIIYACKTLDRLVMVGERNFNFSLYLNDNLMNGEDTDEFDPGGLLDTLYNRMLNGECMFDMRMYEFYKSNFDDYESAYKRYLVHPVDIRVSMYLASRSCIAGNKEYLQILKREDQGISLFETLALFIRPDDSFYAAMLRYQLALLKVPFVLYNKQLHVNAELKLEGQAYNVLGILSGDKSLIGHLQTCDIKRVLTDLG